MDVNTYNNRGRVYPYHTPHQLSKGTEVERTKEWWDTNVGGDRTTGGLEIGG